MVMRTTESGCGRNVRTSTAANIDGTEYSICGHNALVDRATTSARNETDIARGCRTEKIDVATHVSDSPSLLSASRVDAELAFA